MFGIQPHQLRADLQHGESADLRRRRAIVGASLLGMASMGIVSLLQTGVVSHLPDPPLPHFDSDKVNSSEIAYQWGAPDGTLGAVAFALNLPLAAFGGARRAQELPLAPLAALANVAVFTLTLPEARKAWAALRRG